VNDEQMVELEVEESTVETVKAQPAANTRSDTHCITGGNIFMKADGQPRGWPVIDGYLGCWDRNPAGSAEEDVW
jgi:hypothetical protein